MSDVDTALWPVALSVEAFGVRAGVRLNDPRFTDALLSRLPPTATLGAFSGDGQQYSVVLEPKDAPGGFCGLLSRNGTALARRASLEALLRVFEADLQLHVAEMAPERVFVHAGVVGWSGCGILLPGPSFSGKTTLTTELVRAGAEYYSDEYAVLDADGRVHPYARPPAVRDTDASGVVRRRVHDYEGAAARAPLRAAVVLVTQFRADAEWQPRLLSPASGALALLANTVSARRNPERVLATLQRVVATAPVIVSDRADASTVIESIFALATSRRVA